MELQTWIAGQMLSRSDFLSKAEMDAPSTISVSVTIDDGRQFGAWTGQPLSAYTPFAGERFTVETHWGFGEENHRRQLGPFLVVVPDPPQA